MMGVEQFTRLELLLLALQRANLTLVEVDLGIWCSLVDGFHRRVVYKFQTDVYSFFYFTLI